MKNFVRVGLAVLVLFLTACGTLEIALDRPPTPDVAATGTVGALLVQNAELATKIAMLNSPAAASTPIPTALPAASQTPASAMRITFLNGATVGRVGAPILAGVSHDYVLQASRGQPMYVYVASPNSDVTLSITGQDGAAILSAAAHQISWQGTLLKTEDYYLTVYGDASTENYSLTVTIPSRIQFAPGSVSATLNGNTVAGYNVSYSVFAAQGQTMSVHLGDPSGQTSLSIYGFTDGQRYLASDKRRTDYQFVLPATQDYIIVVVPVGDAVVGYSLTLKIQ